MPTSTKQAPSTAPVDAVLKKLEQVSSLNGPLQETASLALRLYDASQEIPSLTKLARDSCEAVYTVVTTLTKMGGNATPEMTAPSRRLHEKLKEMDTFAGTIGKYGSLTLSFIWRRGETAKIKEYEAFIHDIFLDDDLLPKLERKPLRVTTNLGSAGASPQPYQSTTFARSPWSPSNRESLAFYPSPQVSPLSGFHPNSSSPTITTPSTQTKFNSMAFWARSVKEFIYATDYRKSETHLHIHVDGSSNTQTNINMNSCNQKYFFPDVEGRTVYDDYEP